MNFFLSRNIGKIKFFGTVLLILLLSFSFLTMVYPQQQVSGTVVAKQGSGFSRNTRQGEIVIKLRDGKTRTLLNEDNLLMDKRGKFETFQQNIRQGQTYNFKTVGVEIGVLGQHPNILKYTLVDR